MFWCEAPGWLDLALYDDALLTSFTGSFFPFPRILPLHILEVLAVIGLAIAFCARYSRRWTTAGGRLASPRRRSR
jgi:hypothetical protein